MQKIKQQLLVNARKLRREQTEAERLLWYHLRAKRFQKYNFKRQKIIGSYIVDFFCFKAKLIIELDGGHHNEYSTIKYDYERTLFLNSCGLKVIRFWNNEVMRQTEEVLVAIGNELYVSPPSPQPLPQAGEG